MASSTRSNASIRKEIARLTAVLNDREQASKTSGKTSGKGKGRKTTARKTAKPERKGEQSRETLSRSEWNRTLTTLAKTRTGKNSGAYKTVIAEWNTTVTHYRNEGLTPVEVLTALGFTVTF